MSDKRLTTGEAIRYLESIIYEDFAPYTQKCLLKVIESAKQEKSIERIVEKLEQRKNNVDNLRLEFKGTMSEERFEAKSAAYKKSIEIVKAGGVDEID